MTPRPKPQPGDRIARKGDEETYEVLATHGDSCWLLNETTNATTNLTNCNTLWRVLPPTPPPLPDRYYNIYEDEQVASFPFSSRGAADQAAARSSYNRLAVVRIYTDSTDHAEVTRT